MALKVAFTGMGRDELQVFVILNFVNSLKIAGERGHYHCFEPVEPWTRRNGVGVRREVPNGQWVPLVRRFGDYIKQN